MAAHIMHLDDLHDPVDFLRILDVSSVYSSVNLFQLAKLCFLDNCNSLTMNLI